MNSQRARRHSLTGGGGTISLGAALEAGRKAAKPLSKEDHSISLASGYTEDPTEREPTERTERSFNLSSSLRLSETGELMVTSTPRSSRKTPLPPPPFREDQAEVQEMPKKQASFRRRSVFGSIPLSVSDHPVSSPSAPPKPPKSERRNSYFGSSGTNNSASMNEFHDSIDSQFSLHDITDHSKEESVQKPMSMHSMSSASLDLGSSFGNLSVNDLVEKKKKKIRVKKFIKKIKGKGSSKKHTEEEKTTKSQDTSAMDSHEFSTGEQALDESSEHHKKPRGRARRHSLFGSAGGDKKAETTDDAKPPMTPKATRRRRRSLFGNAGGDSNNKEAESSHSRSVQQESPGPSSRAKSPGRLRRMLGNSSETETATLQPASPQRSNNPYKLVNAERTARSLQPFIRSMLLDSLAKDVAEQLSKSDGKKCRSTDYFGNVGKGIDVWTIHQKMMALEGTEKANVISEKFYLFGIGMARGKDGQIYLCELFN